jgi:hypothetical protein
VRRRHGRVQRHPQHLGDQQAVLRGLVVVVMVVVVVVVACSCWRARRPPPSNALPLPPTRTHPSIHPQAWAWCRRCPAPCSTLLPTLEPSSP